MALRRVRSKTEPFYESIVSDEWIERFPDDFDVIDDEPAQPVPSQAPVVTDPGQNRRVLDDDDDPDYR